LRLRSEQIYSREPEESDPGCEERTEARELVPQLLACLKERELEMVLRRLRDEEPIDVISRDLGISPDGSYKLLHTAVEKLKDAKRRLELTERRQLSTARPRRPQGAGARRPRRPCASDTRRGAV